MGLLDLLTGKGVNNRIDFEKFMTDTEIEEAKQVATICNRNVSDTMARLKFIKDIDVAYNGEQEIIENRPNSRVNLIHPNVEGQVADIALQQLGFLFKGQEEIDAKFADDARILTEWNMEHQNNLQGAVATFARRLVKYGNSFLKQSFNHMAFDGFGLATIETPNIDRVFIDQKITNCNDIQSAEYIFEYIDMSKSQAIAIYGKDKAEAISYGGTGKKTELIFTTDEFRTDNETYWMLIQFWNNEGGVLRCREYTDRGLLLFDSMKGSDRKENQKTKEVDFEQAIYTKVYNRYPYVMAVCYERDGELYGTGDVKLISDIQDIINTMYDNIRVSTRPNRLLVDSRSNIDPEELNEESFEPIPFDGSMMENQAPVREVIMGTPSPEWWRMIDNLVNNIQRITMYNDLMNGQGNAGRTATESAILQQQGSKTTTMKLAIVSNAMKEAALYCLGLDLQYKKGKKSMRITGDSNETQFINFDALNNIPVTVPMEIGEREKWRQSGYSDETIPGTQILEENGKPVTRSIALDLKVSIGNKMPKSPAMFGQLINQFASLQLMSEDGQPRPAIFWEEFRDVLTEVYDLPLEDAEKIKEDLQKSEAKREAERQKQMQMEQAQAQAKMGGDTGLASPIPNGSPTNMGSQDGRQDIGVMQGNMDFQATQ
jgi:hypothetical protein